MTPPASKWVPKLGTPSFEQAKTGNSTCGHCNGVGQLAVPKLNNTYSTPRCPYCNGTGKV